MTNHLTGALALLLSLSICFAADTDNLLQQAATAGPAATASAPAQNGPPAGGGTVQPTPVAGSGAVDAGTQPNPNAVLTASNAREVAGVSCTTAQGDTCLAAAKGILDAISVSFNGTILGPDGKDSSALSTKIKEFLRYKIAAPDGSNTVWDRRTRYALIHLVQYGLPKDNGTENLHDKWLLATAGKGDQIELSESLHIPGARRIALVFIHLNANVLVPKCQKTGVTRDQALQASDDISYRAIVEKKLPINIQNLLALLKLATGNLQSAKDKEATKYLQVHRVGFGVLQKVDVPSDVTVFGAHVGTTSKLIGQSQKYDNEGKYLWDVSVAVPVNKLSLLDYSSDSGGVYSPKTINKQSIYAVINIYPDLVDLKYGNKRFFLPRAIAGIGLTGRPGENFIVGGAWGIKELQFFVGSAFANHKVLKPGSDPTSGSSFVERYSSHLAYGINVPVFSAIKKMASASKAAATK